MKPKPITIALLALSVPLSALAQIPPSITTPDKVQSSIGCAAEWFGRQAHSASLADPGADIE